MFGWFAPKKSLLKSGLLAGMTDIHAHLLPGVDDGIPDRDSAVDALRYLEEQVGVKRIYFTPHIMDDLPDNDKGSLTTRLASFLGYYKGGISVRLGGEYMLDAGFRRHLREGLLAMSANHVLVETSYLSAPPDLESLLYELSISGYIPVIAHPERYAYMSDDDRYVLKDRGYKFQLNLMSLAGTYGKGPCRCASALLKAGFYDFVGSDLHKKEVYERSLEHLFLTGSQQKQVKQLVENNDELWD